MRRVTGCGNKADTAAVAARPRTGRGPADDGAGGPGRRVGHDGARVSGIPGKLDKGIEVYNVAGAGGTIGLSQLVSKGSGNPYQLMMIGLVMLGAIETNGSDVPTSRETTPIATLITETEAIVVPANSSTRRSRTCVADFKARPGLESAGRAARRAAPISSCVGQLARVRGRRPAKRTKYVAHSGGGEANAAILSGSVDAGISGDLRECTDQVEAGKMRVLAVSTPEPTEVAGKQAKTIKDQGVDLEITNWRVLVAPPGHQARRARRRDHRLGEEGAHDSAEWQRRAQEATTGRRSSRPGDEFDDVHGLREHAGEDRRSRTSG